MMRHMQTFRLARWRKHLTDWIQMIFHDSFKSKQTRPGLVVTLATVYHNQFTVLNQKFS